MTKNQRLKISCYSPFKSTCFCVPPHAAEEEERRLAAVYTTCMGGCVPQDYKPKIAGCKTKCRKSRHWETCIGKCVPKEVDDKVVSCSQECVLTQPKEVEKEKEEISAGKPLNYLISVL